MINGIRRGNNAYNYTSMEDMINDQLWGNNASNNSAADSRRNFSNNTGPARIRTDLEATRPRHFWNIDTESLPVLETPRLNEHDSRAARAPRVERDSQRRSTLNSSSSKKRKRKSSSHVPTDEEIELARRPVVDPPRPSEQTGRVARYFRAAKDSSRRMNMIALSTLRGEKNKQQKKKQREYYHGMTETHKNKLFHRRILNTHGDNPLQEQLEMARRPVVDPPRVSEQDAKASRGIRMKLNESRRKLMISLSKKRSEKREKDQEEARKIYQCKKRRKKEKT